MGELLYNPFDPEFRANPYPFYDRLRDLEPAHRTPLGALVLSRYEDVSSTLRSADFSRDIDRNGPPPATAVLARRRERRAQGAKSILNLDPPDHTRLRRLVSKAFTPPAIEALRPRIQQLVDTVLDRAQEQGAMELVDDLAFPIPFQVISDLLDMPIDRADEMRDCSARITASLEPTADEATLDASDAALAVLLPYLVEIIEHRRKHLGDDILSALIMAEEAGDRLSVEELITFVVLLFVAGHETTVNLIGNGTLALLRHPDEMARWRADPSLDVNAVDELLRYDGPVQLTVRVPMVDVTYMVGAGGGGDRAVVAPAHSIVTTLLGAANHDPAVFDDPHVLRLDRPNANRHLSFAAGIHYCLGSSLAKLEAQIAIGSLIRRFPKVELAGEPRWRDRLTIRGVDHLPLTLT